MSGQEEEKRNIDPGIIPSGIAVKMLGVTPQRLQRMVYDGVLVAYVYNDDGTLRAKSRTEDRRGQSFVFYKRDIDTYATSPRVAGRREKPAKDKRAAYQKAYYRLYGKAKRAQAKLKEQKARIP